MELFNALGLNLKILLAQFINFAVLLFVLWKYGYKPLLKMMDDRKKKIEKGVEDAQLATEKLNDAEKAGKETIITAKKEALAIIDKAKVVAEDKKKEIVESAKEEVAQVINSEKEKIQQDKAEALKDVKNELASLVVMALEKVLGEKIDPKKDEALIAKVIKDLK